MADGLASGKMLARDLFAALAEATADPPGVTRVAYGEGEQIAHRIVASAAVEAGAEVAVDAAGNQFLTLPGRYRTREIIIGSHLDSVPHGGNYDGAAGVIAGVALLRAFSESVPPPVDLTTLCIRAEESCWFPWSYVGSKAALGLLEPEVLDTVRRSDTGRSLAEHMAEDGFDPEAVRRGAARIRPERVLAYIEPHIEQGPLLLDEGRPLAIVTGIRGSFRYRSIRIIGETAHSGALPRRLRRDAVVAGARLVEAMQALWLRREVAGEDLTATFGEFFTDPAQHSFSKVPGLAQLCLDVRSESEETLASVRAEFLEIAARIAAECSVAIEPGPLTGSAPALMNEGLNERLAVATQRRGIAVRRMPSGAGHDAAVFAQAGVPATMLFIRNAHGSHNPDELMDLADFDLALEVLHAMITDWGQP